MGRARRCDEAGTLWHIVNRGLAQREIYEDAEDFRAFLDLLEGAVGREWIEVHAFCLMHNHFHLVVRSVAGELSKGMKWIEDLHVRRFNRRVGRTGHLLQGRFWGKPIRSRIYLGAAVGYVHANPVRAGMVVDPRSYPYSSARYLGDGPAPWWLSRDLLSTIPQATACGAGTAPELVERWMAHRGDDLPEIDELSVAPAPHVKRWLRENARQAEGLLPPRVLVRPSTLEACLRTRVAQDPPDPVALTRRPRDAVTLAFAGLLRSTCALSMVEIADRVGLGRTAVPGWVRAHKKAMLQVPAYAGFVAFVLRDALQLEYGGMRER